MATARVDRGGPRKRRSDAMSSARLVNLSSLVDDAKCYELTRQSRWRDGVCCPYCSRRSVARDGHHDTQRHRQRHRQRYRCTACQARFDIRVTTPNPGKSQPGFRLTLHLSLSPKNRIITLHGGVTANHPKFRKSQNLGELVVKHPQTFPKPTNFGNV